MSIRCLITGGTIDKQYNWADGSLIFSESSIEAMFTQGRCTAPIVFETVFLKDSLDHTEEDKQQLIDCCLEAEESRIIITHGTDTMVQTAQKLNAQLCQESKTVVLVGAMVPFAFKKNDALFNLGAATTAVQCLPPGVYIVMNGQVFDADFVQKDRNKGVFTATEAAV